MDKKVMYAGIALLFCGFFMGHVVASIVFFGILSASSIVFLIETGTCSFKLWCGRWGFIIDLVLFLLSALAVVNVGVTMAGGLAVASLIFTLYRKYFLVPYYRDNKPVVEPKSLWHIIVNGWTSCMTWVGSLFSSKTVDAVQ